MNVFSVYRTARFQVSHNLKRFCKNEKLKKKDFFPLGATRIDSGTFEDGRGGVRHEVPGSGSPQDRPQHQAGTL